MKKKKMVLHLQSKEEQDSKEESSLSDVIGVVQFQVELTTTSDTVYLCQCSRRSVP